MEGTHEPSDPQQRALVSEMLREETLGLQGSSPFVSQFGAALAFAWALRTEEGILQAVEQHFGQETQPLWRLGAHECSF